ncbi:MAG TPA: TIGR03809 family protein [Pseudolabrys sp.]|nr:TIGR03809 family protein [Pseudolabrys sp.]
MSAPPAERSLDQAARKWCSLAERRRDHYVELYQSGRWKHYYSEEQFRERLRDAVEAVNTWAQIAGLRLAETSSPPPR